VAVADLIEAAGAGLVCRSDPEAFCQVLLRHCHGPSFAMRLAARSFAESTFSWASVADQLERSYRRMLHPPAV